MESILEDNIEEDNSVKETNNNYLLVIIPLTTILIVIIGGITDLQLENLLLRETIVDLLVIAEEHAYKSEIIESNLYG